MFHHKPMCEICGQRVATIFITRMVGGKSRKESLCEVCAREHTQGEDWLKSMAQKFGLPETASLEDVMQGITEKMPTLGTPEEYALAADAAEEDAEEDVPDLILEANLQFFDTLSADEFPADEDAADALDDAWSEIEEKLFAAQDEPANPHSGEPTDDSAFGEISYEAMKANWLGKTPSTPPQKNITPQEPSKEVPREIIAERCPKCGTTWDRLREDGRVGCAQCYVAFHDRLIDVMNRMQREAHHVGKVPRAALKRRRRLEHLRARRDHRLEMLNRRLQEAVKAENYEDAAKLRDKIKIVASTIVDDQ